MGVVEPEPISAVDDPRLAPFRNLQRQRGERLFVVESAFAVHRLLASGWPVVSVVATPSRWPELAEAVTPPTLGFVASRTVLREVVGFDFHRGVLAAAVRPQWSAPDWTALCATERSTVLAVNGVTDPANLGSLIRSARALGCDHVILDAQCGDPLSRRAIRGSMGHVFSQAISRVTDLQTELTDSQRFGAKWWASTPAASAHDLRQVATHRPSHCVLAVGHEGFGLDPQLLQAADLQVTISMRDAVDSLGVAAATAAMLYALSQGRSTHDRG